MVVGDSLSQVVSIGPEEDSSGPMQVSVLNTDGSLLKVVGWWVDSVLFQGVLLTILRVPIGEALTQPVTHCD